MNICPINVTREFKFDAAHRLFDYPGKCKNIHGHSYKLYVTIQKRNVTATEDQFGEHGMLVDFGDMKKCIGSLIDDTFDHSIIIDDKDEELITFCQDQKMRYVLIPGGATAERMALYLLEFLNDSLKIEGVIISKIKLYETDTCCAECSIG